MSKSILFLFILILHSYCQETENERETITDLRVPKEPVFFQNNASDKLTKIAFFESTKNLLIGGRNVLYKLDEEFNKTGELIIGPSLDNPKCVPSQEKCKRKSTDNEVKVLLPYSVGKQPATTILVCGTVDQGMCHLHSLANITLKYTIGDSSNSISYLASRNSTVAFFSKSQLFSAVTYDQRPLDLFGSFISSRTIQLKPQPNFHYTYSSEESLSALSFSPNYRGKYQVDYVYGFSYHDFAYFVTIQPVQVKNTQNIYETRLARVCQSDKKFFSYTEIPLKCQRETGSYELATAAFLANFTEAQRHSHRESDFPFKEDSNLYIAFAKSKSAKNVDEEKGSVMCRFLMSNVESAFRNETIHCFQSEPRTHTLESVHGSENRCKAVPGFKIEEVLCGSGTNSYIEGRTSISGSFSSYVSEITTSLLITYQHNAPMAFLGTSKGNVLKVSLKLNEQRVLYNVSISEGNERVEPSIAYDVQHENLFLLTGSRAVRFPIGSCSPYPNCASCLQSYDEDPLQCGWCGNYCAHKGECASDIENISCPPIIDSISPRNGSTAGGTLMTINGDNFGSSMGQTIGSESKSESFVKVDMNGSACHVIQWTNNQIKCKTSNHSEASVRVKLIVLSYSVPPPDYIGETESDELFAFVTPKFYGVWPPYGPRAGGTNVTLFGENLNIGSNRSIKLVTSDCKIYSLKDTSIECTSGPIASKPSETITGGINFTIDAFNLPGHPMEYNNVHSNGHRVHEYFKYHPNPIIHSISPLRTVRSGGNNLTVQGENLNFVLQSRLVIQMVNLSTLEVTKITQNCSHGLVGGREIVCLIPSMNNKFQWSKNLVVSASIKIIMDGVKDLPDFELSIFPDPRYHSFQHIFKVPVDQPVVVIEGENLNKAHSKKDITVLIQGSTECIISKVTTETLYCSVPQNVVPKHGNNSLRTVEVSVGNLNFNVGSIQFVDPPFHLSVPGIVGIVIGLLVALLIILLILWRTGYLRRLKKPKYMVAYIPDQEENAYVDVPLGQNSNVDGSRPPGGTCGQNAATAGACSAGTTVSRVSEEKMALLRAEGILLPRSYLTTSDVIGQGTFGKVYKGILMMEGKEDLRSVAVKTLQNSRFRDNEDVEDFLKEGLLMKDFHHDNVLGLIGVCFEDDGFPMVIIPFMPKGDLLSYIRDENNYPTVKDLLTAGIHIAEGMKYLADLKFVHRDLAARNCMLDEDLTLKVADFGLSRDIYEKDYYSSDNKKSKLPVKWMAPESLEKGTYTSKTDVWSYGVVLWELMTRGVTPYPEVDNWQILQYVKSGRRMPQPSFCPDLLYQMMLKCWTEDPRQRPAFAELAEGVKEIIQKMEAKSKMAKVGTNVSYYNLPAQNQENETIQS